ncbi:MAG: hypothetical protein GF411_09745 [Candidatus Lokiarchaeota archaeon]|nr:hypothetical protein [Candidatus Lokiarchaeota archaeon]
MIDTGERDRILRTHTIKVLVNYERSSQSLKSLLRERYDSFSELKQHRNLVDSLSYGTITYLNTIDWLISHSGPKSAKQLPILERTIARLAVYEGRWLNTKMRQLIEYYLHKIPEMISPIRNAINTDLEEKLSSYPLINRLSIELSHPTFLVETLLDNLSHKQAIELMRTNNGQRSYFMRINKLLQSQESVLEDIRELGIDFIEDSDISGLYLIRDGITQLVQSESFKKGYVLIQDKASVQTVKLLNPKSDEVIWDACAAPGMKTQLISEYTSYQGTIFATESSNERISIAKKRANDLGYSSVKWILADASSVPIRNADKILIDAPCSSTGILWSYPSFKWTLNKDSLMALMVVQNKILDAIIEAYEHKIGTELVYATCSILPHEGESQIDSVLARYPFIELINPDGTGSMGYPAFDCASRIQRFFPHIHNTSGFFISHFKITG